MNCYAKITLSHWTMTLSPGVETAQKNPRNAACDLRDAVYGLCVRFEIQFEIN